MLSLPLKALRLSACVLSLSLVAGCGDACQNLASQICQCLPDDGSRAACVRRAREAAATYAVRPQDEQFCQQKLDAKACDCHVLDTPEGKAGCGIAWTTPLRGSDGDAASRP
jgi:hypothetical protein